MLFIHSVWQGGLLSNEDYVHPSNIHSNSTVPHISTTAPGKPGHHASTVIHSTLTGQELLKNEESTHGKDLHG